MTVEFRDNTPQAHSALYRNGEEIPRVVIDIRNLPRDTNVAPFYPSPTPDGTGMEISPRMRVLPYRLEACLGTNEVPLFTLRHAQFSAGLPVTLFDYNDQRVEGKLHPIEDSSNSF